MSELTPPTDQSPPADHGDSPPAEQIFLPNNPFELQQSLPHAASQSRLRTGRGRRSFTVNQNHGGHFLRAIRPTGTVRDVALLATLRAMALRVSSQPHSAKISPPSVPPKGGEASSHILWKGVRGTDLRVKLRQQKTGNLLLFLVDASGSMGARKRMIAVKEAVLSLLLDAYQKRDRVGLISFRGQQAELLVPPTNSVDMAARNLRHLPTGGRTPLLAGLQQAERLLQQYQHKQTALTPMLILLTDGRGNVGQTEQVQQVALTLAQQGLTSLVLDSEQGFVRLGAARQLATWLGAEYMALEQLQGQAIVNMVREKHQLRIEN
ncbi:VWA domain-containing protein [Anaerolineales bacterium HSG6]|nr:VWA domain-containing protein [Anaerolineales bacterium HSG6]